MLSVLAICQKGVCRSLHDTILRNKINKGGGGFFISVLQIFYLFISSYHICCAKF